MQAIIDIYRMTEVSPKTRAKIMISLGKAINYQFASNCTEGLVYELVKSIDPDNKILADEHYLLYAED